MGTPIKINPVFVKKSHFQLFLKTKTNQPHDGFKNTKEITYN